MTCSWSETDSQVPGGSKRGMDEKRAREKGRERTIGLLCEQLQGCDPCTPSLCPPARSRVWPVRESGLSGKHRLIWRLVYEFNWQKIYTQISMVTHNRAVCGCWQLTYPHMHTHTGKWSTLYINHYAVIKICQFHMLDCYQKLIICSMPNYSACFTTGDALNFMRVPKMATRAFGRNMKSF